MKFTLKMYHLWFCLLGLALVSCSQNATVAGGYMDETETTVSGNLLTDDGKPVAGIQLQLHQDFRSWAGAQHLDSLQTATASTDSLGHYQIKAKGAGLWHLEAVGSGVGVLRDVHTHDSLANQNMGTDTLQPLQRLVLPAQAGKVFVAQTAQIIDLSSGPDTLNIPQGSYEVFALAPSSAWPDTTSKTLIPSSPVSSWIPIGLWPFNKPNSWNDTSGNSIYMTNIAGGPGDSATWLEFLGNSCVQLLDQPSLMHPSSFKIDVRVKFPVFTGTQSIVCANDTLASHSAWCLNITNDSLAEFWYRDTLGNSSSVIAQGLLPNVYQDISVQVRGDTVIISSPVVNVSAIIPTLHFANVATAPTLGCRQNQASNDQFFTGEMDNLDWYRAAN